MPYIFYGDVGKGNQSVITGSDVKYDYTYPVGLDLRPTSELHRFIVTEVLRRAQVSRSTTQNRFDSWNEIDRCLTAYIEPDTSGLTSRYNEETDLKANKATKNKPTSIVFPYSYAIMETILTYLVMAFFQDPIFRYEGVSPEDTIGAILMEKMIDLHCSKTKVALALHTMFRDALAYGVGIGAPTWEKRIGAKVTKSDVGFMNFFNLFKKTGQQKQIIEGQTLFEGNALNNIDPYLWLPDPNTPVDKIQKGEYSGWIDRTSFVNLLNSEATGTDLFNVRYLKLLINKKSSLYGEDMSKRGEKTGTQIRTAGGNHEATNPVDIVNMYVNLIPKDWKISTSEYPEKWLFSVASDSIVIKAKPLGLSHNMYPIATIAPDADGYTTLPVSRMEVLYGMQNVLDWLFNSHIANVRKAINDMIVYDPYLINSKDLEEPGPGKLVRIRRPAWGRGVENSVMQLKISDITRGNITDSSWVMNGMEKVGGADEAAMGALRQGGPERLTKGEFQGTQSGAMGRLQRVAMLIGIQGMQDIGYMFGSHAQQLATEDHFVQCTGAWRDELIKEFGVDVKRNRVKVSPFDILVDYDMKVRDGSVPGNNFSEVWMRMFDILATHPELDAKFDIVRIFRHIARNAGAKNVTEFERPAAKIVPDEAALRGAEAGNLIPA